MCDVNLNQILKITRSCDVSDKIRYAYEMLMTKKTDLIYLHEIPLYLGNTIRRNV
jgi:hypothetical protein